MSLSSDKCLLIVNSEMLKQWKQVEIQPGSFYCLLCSAASAAAAVFSVVSASGLETFKISFSISVQFLSLIFMFLNLTFNAHALKQLWEWVIPQHHLLTPEFAAPPANDPSCFALVLERAV